MSQLDSDIIVVGSGASGVHTALPLVESGRDVLMIDIGLADTDDDSVPNQDWKSLRKNDEEQWRYFLGENYEGLPLGPVRVGAQLTPSRQQIKKDSDRIFPLKPHHFSAMQATCIGGLAAGWGGSSMPFSEADLKGWPLSLEDLRPHYDDVAKHIGLSAPEDDDLTGFLGGISPAQKPPKLDSNGAWILGKYEKVREKLNQQGLYLGQSRLAIKTDRAEENYLQYNDLEFWGKSDNAVYRPVSTLKELESKKNFSCKSGICVLSFEETGEGITVIAKELETGRIIELTCKALFLAGGAINSARIVLRSFEHYHDSVPLLSNPYSYYPSFNLSRLGKPTRDRRHSLTQLTMLYDHEGDGRHLVQPQLYSYRSLLLFKLIKESPLPTRESIRLFQTIQDYLVIIGVFHEDRKSKSKELILRKGNQPENDWLELRYQRQEHEILLQQEKENTICKLIRKLGVYPIKRINPGDGASIHYAGTLPMSDDDKPLTLKEDGVIRGTKQVYVTDGSGFPHLPAKGLTMTLMANAQRIASGFSK